MSRSPRPVIAILAVILGIAACTPAAMGPSKGALPASNTLPAARGTSTSTALRNAKVVEPAFHPAHAAQAARIVRGTVRLGGPVVSASVTAIDANGKVLAGPFTTNRRGSFTIPAAGLPANFVILARGGHVGSQPFAGDLVAMVRGLNAATNIVTVGVPSTIARVAAASDRRSLAHLALLASARLGLTPNLALRSADAEFDAQRFLADAQANGGLENYVKALAKDLESRPAAKGSYLLGGIRRQSVALDLGIFIGKNIAAGIVSAIGGKGANEAMNWLGLGPSGPTTQDVLNKLDAVSSQIDAVQADLENVRQGLTGKLDTVLYTQLHAPLVPIITANKAYYAKIQHLAEATAEPVVATPLPTPVPAPYNNPFSGGWEFVFPSAYTLLQEDDDDVDPDSAAGILLGIRRDLVDTNSLDVWNQQVLGDGSGDNMIQAFNRAAGFNGFMNHDSATQIDTFWRYIDAQQAMTMYLQAQYRLAKKFDAKPMLSNWANNRSKQFMALRGGTITSSTLDLSESGLSSYAATNTHVLPSQFDDYVARKGVQGLWWLSNPNMSSLVDWNNFFIDSNKFYYAQQLDVETRNIVVPSVADVLAFASGPGADLTARLAPVWGGDIGDYPMWIVASRPSCTNGLPFTRIDDNLNSVSECGDNDGLALLFLQYLPEADLDYYNPFY